MKDGSTGNLRKHIKSKHSTLMESGEAPVSIISLLSGQGGNTPREVQMYIIYIHIFDHKL